MSRRGRDFEPRFANIREAREGDACPKCGGGLVLQTAIEVGHIFKLGTRYCEPLDAKFLDEDGKEKPLVMGSYGIGPGRTMAAVVEQHHDETASCGRRRSRRTTCTRSRCRAPRRSGASRWRRSWTAAGDDVLLDDRDRRAGEKFADADLIGLPVRVTVGKKTLDDGAVDVRSRQTGEETRVAIAELGEPSLMARRRRFSDDPFGETLERLMTENGVTYRGARREDEALGRLPEPPRAREPAGAVERDRRALASALDVEPEHFREYRLRVITERLEEMPDADRPAVQAPRRGR